MDRVPRTQIFCGVGVLAATAVVIALRPRPEVAGPIEIHRPGGVAVTPAGVPDDGVGVDDTHPAGHDEGLEHPEHGEEAR